MATFNTTMYPNKPRPCWVEGRRAIFHRWTDSARPVKARGVEEDENAPRYQLHSVHALVEYEDGTMERVWPNAVQFADSDALFAGYDWEGMEHRRDELPYTYTDPAEKTTEETHRNCLNCGNQPAMSACDHKCFTCHLGAACNCWECNGIYKWKPQEGQV